MPPLVTVVIPSRDRHALLRRAVESVLHQTYGTVEVVVVDDGSRDETAAYLAGLDDARVVGIRLPESGGAAAARNLAIGRARGSLVAFLDSDDWWEPDKLARQVQLLQAHAGPRPAVACITGVRAVRDGAAPELHLPSGCDCERDVLRFDRWQVGVVSCLVVDTAVARAEWFDEHLGGLEDWDFYLRVARRGCVLADVRSSTVVEEHRGPRMWSGDRPVRGYRAVVEKYRSEFARDPVARNEVWRRLALEARRSGNMAAVREALAVLARRGPHRVRASWWWLVAVLGAGPFDLAVRAVKVAARVVPPLSGMVPFGSWSTPAAYASSSTRP